MPLYRLTHGSYKAGPGDYRHAGDVLELSEAEAKELGDAVLPSMPLMGAPEIHRAITTEIAAQPIPAPAPSKGKRAKK